MNGSKSRGLCIFGKHPTKWATFPALQMCFEQPNKVTVVCLVRERKKRGAEEDLYETRLGVMARPAAKALGGTAFYYSHSGQFAMVAFPPGVVGPKMGCVALDASWQWVQGN